MLIQNEQEVRRGVRRFCGVFWPGRHADTDSVGHFDHDPLLSGADLHYLLGHYADKGLSEKCQKMPENAAEVMV